MKKTLNEIASYLGGEVSGNGSVEIKGVAGIEEAKPGDLTFVANPKYLKSLATTSASAAITGVDVSQIKIPIIKHPNPYYAFSKAMVLFCSPEKSYPEKIDPTALLGKEVQVGRGVYVGPYVIIEDRAKLSDKVVILGGSFIGENTVIGENSLVYPNVTIRENVTVGRNTIIHSGTVIGSDGFGYAKEKGVYHKIPQVGKVVLEDNVEIGANVTIDRATLGETRISKGTKIDNLVQIAHNVKIDENSIVVAQVGISGSTKVGKNVTLAGQVGLVGHIEIGDNVIIGAQSGVSKSIPPGKIFFGYPAREHSKARKIEAIISLLPQYVDKIRELEKKVKSLEEKLSQNVS
jgi:UDP-3-O-[3-hydroxymyristoyl] glucosamine N-acyltransferase